ncbi:hypothetical protein [Vallitalea guaymasensis]|uniref:hypothetical protein n=1 Tax=Vallitalea guaymasensis TaxID=1185412 RepID=UPI00272BA8E7|nr:hypothetical protein [Vallitalea guaymasensis]
MLVKSTCFLWHGDVSFVIFAVYFADTLNEMKPNNLELIINECINICIKITNMTDETSP